ncbi:MAG: SMC-Scp complex subunit ScpB [archaeon]
MKKEEQPKEESNPHITSQTVQELDESKEVENLKKIEAAFFLSARYLSLNELVLLTDINPLMLKELIEKLAQKYNTEESAMEIISKENMWKMDVKQEYVSMVNKLATGTSEFTKAEQETLAVIAYKQPVKQSVIIKIRGNKAYDHIKHFIDIGLVQAKRAGHTKELRLSDDFFDYFHLQKGEDGGLVELKPNNLEEPPEEDNSN